MLQSETQPRVLRTPCTVDSSATGILIASQIPANQHFCAKNRLMSNCDDEKKKKKKRSKPAARIRNQQVDPNRYPKTDFRTWRVVVKRESKFQLMEETSIVWSTDTDGPEPRLDSLSWPTPHTDVDFFHLQSHLRRCIFSSSFFSVLSFQMTFL